MPAPSYTTDLTTITLAESTTGWDAYGGGGAGLGVGADLSAQGSLAVDKKITNEEKGMMYDNGSGIAQGADNHIFIWHGVGTPGLMDTFANRGQVAAIGTGTNAFVKFHLAGVDTLGATARVIRCWAIRYVNTSSSSRTLVGSPGATPRYFGGGLNTTGSVKGTNFAVDAIRYGTGIYIISGDAGTPATFGGASAQNDTLNNRWGVLTFVDGSSYELQGRFVIGQNSSKTPTAAHFTDSDKTILLVNTPHSLSTFTQFIVDHASTVLDWNNISIEASGTNNPGRLNIINGTVTLTDCKFIKLGISVLRSTVTASGCSWDACGQVTAAGADLSNSTIKKYAGSQASALLWNTATDTSGKLDNMSFVKGSAAKHALELGANTPSAITLSGQSYSGYAATDGSAGDEAVFNNSGKSITINIVGGGVTPSIRNGTGASTTLVDAKTLTINDIVAGSVFVVYDNDSADPQELGTELMRNNSANATELFNYDATKAGDTVVLKALADGYKPYEKTIILPSSDAPTDIKQIVETN